MAKRKKRHSLPQAAGKPAWRIPPVAIDALIVIVALYCFWPLTKFYFAQDDFVFLERAVHGIAASAGRFFSLHPGQFRPLTKGLYFLVAWPLFGLHAAPYHVVSILLHGLNAVLIAVLLRRLGVSRGVSRVVAVFFAFNVAFMEAIAWISCVQQLISGIFMLLALIAGVDAIEGRGRRARVATAVFYVLALASYEQTMAVPLVLLAWQWSRRGFRSMVDTARGPLLASIVLMLAYAVFMFGAKGLPPSGPYSMHVGRNVLDNLRTYTGLAFSVWLIFPAYGLPTGFTASHAVWVLAIATHVMFRLFRGLAFGLVTFLLLLAPVLFTTNHTQSFHLYIPALGAWFLVASALDGLRWLSGAVTRRRVDVVLAAAAIACVAGSVVVVRKNTSATIAKHMPLPPSFVLRRAVLAERMCHDIRAKSTRYGKGGRVVLVYPHPEYHANWRNIHAALGQGSAVRLVLDSPDLDVVMSPPEPLPPLDDPSTEVFYYTEMGRCYTAAERAEALRLNALHGRRPVAPPDTLEAAPRRR